MKDRYKLWAQVAASVLSSTPQRHKTYDGPTIKIIRLAGFQEVEDEILTSFCRSSHRVDSLVNFVSKETFGITYDDTLFEVPDDYRTSVIPTDEDYAIDAEGDAYDEQFKTDNMTDDEAAAYLKTLGLDFTNDRGQPLRSTLRFCRQAEAAAKGIMGKMPDPELGSLDRLRNNLEEQARRFMKEKRRP